MATNSINEATEKKFLVTLLEKDECNPNDKELIELALNKNNLSSLAASTIFEKALIYQSRGKLKLTSENYRDFNDDSDAKLGTTRKKHNTMTASINCSGKLGAIRLWVKESKTDTDYYFYIPRHAYSKYITIPFDIEGNPKIKNKFWKYKVDFLKDLALKF